MIVRIFFGALLSAAVVFVWGFLYWGMSGASQRLMEPVPAEKGLVDAMREAGLGTGMYLYPMPAPMDDQQAIDEATAKHEAGPIFQLAFRADGGPVMPPEQYIVGLSHSFATALLAGLLLSMAAPSLPSYGQRVLFVLLIGLTATVWINFGDAIWWSHPWIYAGGVAIYHLVASLLMGLFLAALVKVKPAEAA